MGPQNLTLEEKQIKTGPSRSERILLPEPVSRLLQLEGLRRRHRHGAVGLQYLVLLRSSWQGGKVSNEGWARERVRNGYQSGRARERPTLRYLVLLRASKRGM